MQEDAPRAETAPERRPTRRRRLARRAGIVLLLAATLSGTYAATTWLALWLSVRVPDVTVPDVVDLSLDEAKERLEAARLRARVAGRRHDPAEPEGKIVEQRPPPHARTKPGRSVRLVVSLGPPLATMPDLTGSSLGRARIALAGAGLRLVQSASVPHPAVPVGRVIAQYPEPGTSVDKGGAVSLLVSAGPPARAFVMPDLLGVPGDRAKALLQRAGFTRVRMRGPARAGAVVVSQRPTPGARVGTNDVVVLQAGTVLWPAANREAGGGAGEP